MSTLADTHAHLCDAAFDGDRDAVLARAAAAGISAVLAVGETLQDAERNLALAARHPMIRPAAGLYPEHLDLGLAEKMRAFIRGHLDRIAAIGEVGLDYWIVRDESARETQREIFRGFIELGSETGLPVNVHSRSAGRHAVGMLLEAGARRVQLHAFDGKLSAAMPAAEAGYFFSIPPSVVRSEQKRKLAKHLPLSCLLLESDSPVLGPDPRERNEPANALLALRCVAELRGISPEEAARSIAENTRRLYGDSLS